MRKMLKILFFFLFINTNAALPDGGRLCDEITPMRECTHDRGPREPAAGQIVFLEDSRHSGEFYYPGKHGSDDIGTWQAATSTITTTGAWAGWKWIPSCGYGTNDPDIICLESTKQGKAHKYFTSYTVPFWWWYKNAKMIRFLYDPQQATDKSKFKILSRTPTQNRDNMYTMKMMSVHDYKKYGYTNEWGSTDAVLSVNVFMPNRCVGWELVKEQCNDVGGQTATASYQHRQGITEGSSTTEGVTAEIKYEVQKAFTTGGSFGYSWSRTDSRSSTQWRVSTDSVPVEPGRRVRIWQKVALYGPYHWKTATVILCHSKCDEL